MARPSSLSLFDRLYKGLNKEQKLAVDTIEGPVMVVAGPGTGKTSILTLRVANILKRTDVGADSILALTFTESGVHAMRERLVEIIGSRAYKVGIYTFHGFCNDIIRRFPDYFPRIISATPTADIDQILLMEELIDTLPLERLKPYGDPYYYLQPALSAIAELKRDGIDPSQFKKLFEGQRAAVLSDESLVHERGTKRGELKASAQVLLEKIEKNKELHLLYEAYQARLLKERRYDYEDMIVECVQALKKNKDLLRTLQEEYQYLLADEHQDANAAQNTILELLASFHPNPNLFVVGDEKQAIFRFQGASLQNFLYFQKRFPEAQVIYLKENYRSTQIILDASHSLMEKGSTGLVERVRLLAKREGGDALSSGKIEVWEARRPEEEIMFIVEDVEQKIKEGVPAEEITILYRNNKDSARLSLAFSRTAIPFIVESDLDLLAHEEIKKFLLLLRAIGNPRRDDALTQLLFVDFLQLNLTATLRILERVGERKEPLLQALSSRIFLKGVKLKEAERKRFLSFAQTFSSWVTLSRNKNVLDFFNIIFRESGFLAYLLNRDTAVEILSLFERLFGELERLVAVHPDFSLNDFLRYLDLLQKHNILLKVPKILEREGRVRLMTAHRSKGLEFNHVYIFGANDRSWGGRRSSRLFLLPTPGQSRVDLQDQTEDERRLFYVALTRARERVALTFSREDEEGKPQLPTQFIEEMNQEKIAYAHIETSAKATSTFLTRMQPKMDTVPALSDKKFLNELFLSQGLSVTALNNYLLCPWQFFFDNLVRVPRIPSKFQTYGIAIHGALSRYIALLHKGEKVSPKIVAEIFERALGRLPLSKKDEAELLRKGRRALSGFVTARKKQLEDTLATEEAVSFVTRLPYGEKTVDVRFKGILDAIRLLEGNQVEVIDFKTGKPKTRNEIEGKTKNSNGDYKRQLVFYKMLLDKERRYPYRFARGVIDFVEPDQRGRFHQEVFEIEDGEVNDLFKLCQEKITEILDLSFWNSRCPAKKCPYCGLRDLMKN